MNLLDIPEEVIEGCILPKLDWKELQRFRRASWYAHKRTSVYLNSHPERVPEIEINEEEDKSIEEFLKLGFATNKIFLNISSDQPEEFYERNDAALGDFLRLHGAQVHHLRLSKMSSSITGKEWAFFEGLPNLVSLDVERKVLTVEDTRKSKGDALLQNFERGEWITSKTFPSIFRRLKRLMVGQEHNAEALVQYYENKQLFQFCSNVEHIGLPFAADGGPPEMSWSLERRHLGAAFHSIQQVFLERLLELPQHLGQFLGYDFMHFYHDLGYSCPTGMFDRNGSWPFLELCQFSQQHHINLLNVESSWCQRFSLESGSAEMGLPIVSLINLHPAVFAMDMQNLEKVDIRATSRSSLSSCWRQTRPEWPNLKILKLRLDSWKLRTCILNFPGIVMTQAQRTVDILHFFFDRVEHPQLAELQVDFSQLSLDWQGWEREDKREWERILAKDIVAACPNLKKLTVVGWLGTNGAMSNLWTGLPALEEVTLDSCRNIDHSAFIGRNIEKPAFLQLKHLKKLSLLGLHQMPKISDTLFIKVLRNMELRELILSGEIEKVTIDGIRSLLSGKFAESLEKFPFSGWTLRTSSYEELKLLETQFRPYHMI